MQVSTVNDVKIYNLSAGKSIPEWLSDRMRRKLAQKDIDIRRRIQLLQDFDMPDLSQNITLSRDGRYIFATGTYKPCVKCYDIDNLSLKFSRGLDADAIKLIALSDDYRKFIILQEERYLEFHAAFGRYHRMRIPKFGRDMAFCSESSELYIVGACNEIFRINLEIGRFLDPLKSDSNFLNCCVFNDCHSLFFCGSDDGKVEAWDPRDGQQASTLDCATYAFTDGTDITLPEISCLMFKDALHLGVGTSTGKVLLFDIRSKKPLMEKDLRTDLPVKNIEFVPEQNLVLSMDCRILKMWDESSGKPFAAIEPGTYLMDFCRYQNSGLMFMANEAPKMLQYFVPSIGTAPKWCSFLESITEELEETELLAVYDDYKFVSEVELESIGLSHLIGTNILRSYMHGFFIDVRLYNKAVAFTQPFAYENLRKRKLMEALESERKSKSLMKKSDEWKAPKVNKSLATKLYAQMTLESENSNKKIREKKMAASNLLNDDRFKTLFSNADFEVDEESEQFRHLAPALKKLEDRRQKSAAAEERVEKEKVQSDNEGIQEDEDSLEVSGASASDTDGSDEVGSESAAEARVGESVEETAKHNFEVLDGENEKGDKDTSEENHLKPRGFRLFELGTGEDAVQFMQKGSAAEESAPLGELRNSLKNNFYEVTANGSAFGGRQLSYRLQTRGSLAANKRRIMKNQAVHLRERKESRRSASEISKTLKRFPVRGPIHGRRKRGNI